ncbi:MAG: DUF1353 domain-containing protein [Betaproteobacteria bacterium]|jgi:hypothetical protein|nr:MAG: DUF1353 domain-containing protein [Betaproteobacteria bacterium]
MKRGIRGNFVTRSVTLLWIVALCSGALFAAQEARFDGRIILEWIDDNEFVASMRLVESFSFTQADGKIWPVPAGSVVDGRSMSPLFVRLLGHPFEGGFRQTAVVYDHAAKQQSKPWHEAQKMFLEGSIIEGILPIEAKVMYLLLNATGPRWVVRGESSCFNQCHHTGDAELVWRPLVDDEPVVGLISWVRDEDPTIHDIQQRVGDVILHPGPHIFGHAR